MREGTANKERQEGICDRPGHCGIENSSWEGRENRGPGGREGDAGTDRNIDEGGEDENDGEREKNRRAEERNRGEGGKDEGRGRGNARGGGEKVSRKGERRRRRWRRRQQHTKTRERGEEGRDRREEGRCTAQKLEGGCVPSDIVTGGARGSDERGDRTAGER